MNHSFWDKRIPTLLGLFLIVIGVAATTFLVKQGYVPFLKAAPGDNPQNLRITNITDSSFTVTYITEASVIGSISYGKDSPNGQVVLDDRDQPTGVPTSHTVHSITVRGLQPQTSYQFSIASGANTYLNNDLPFTATTGEKIAQDPSQEEPLSGKIVSNADTLPEMLAYVTTKNGQTLSTLVKPTGIYIIPLNTMRTANLASYLSFDDTTTLQILVVSQNEQSRVNLLATKRNPVPTITFTNNYDFTIDTTPLASTSALPVGFPAFALDTNVIATPKIQTPTKDQNFTDAQPLLQGKAVPGATVTIEIHSAAAVTGKVVADANGNWVFRPSSPLAPGEHTITITTKDSSGILQTIKQTFTILESGTQVAEAATPSATPTTKPSATPSPSKTPTGTVTPTAITPTSIVASPTMTPVPSGLPTSISQPPKGQLPPTGNESAITAGILGIITTIIGIGLFLVTRGATSL